MSTLLTSSLDIAATVSAVWNVLVDLEAFASWNPFVISAAGRAGWG